MRFGAANTDKKSSSMSATDHIPANTTRLYLYALYTGSQSSEIVEVASLDVVLDSSNKVASQSNFRMIFAIAPNNTTSFESKKLHVTEFNGSKKLYDKGTQSDGYITHVFQFISSSKTVEFGKWVRSERKPIGTASNKRSKLFTDVTDPWSGKTTSYNKVGIWNQNIGLTNYTNTNRTVRETVTTKEGQKTVGCRFGNISLTFGDVPSMTLSSSETLTYNTTKDLTYTYSGSATPTVSTDNASVATATINTSTQTITVKATGVGTTTLTLSAAAAGNYEAISKTCTITVVKANGYINLASNSGTISYGTASKSFSVTSHHGGTLSATTSYGTATISGSTVVVSGLGSANVGTTITVTVTSGATSNYNSASATYTITISQVSGYISLNSSTSTITYGTTSKSFTVTNHHGGTLSATTSNGSVNINGTTITVSGLGSLNAGTQITVRVTSGATTNYGSASATHTITVVPKNLVKPSLNSVTYTYNGKTQTASVSNFDPSTMNISGNTRINAGTQTITISLKNTTNYRWADGTTTSLSFTWTINKKSVATNWGSTTTFVYNRTEQAPTASASSGVTGETLNITRTTAINVGNYTSKASISSVSGGQGLVSNYTLTDTERSFTIIKATAKLDLSKYNITIVEGNSTSFTYTYVGDGSIKLTYGAPITVNVSGTTVSVKAVKEGDTDLIVSFAGTNYTDVSQTVKVKVLRANYKITTSGTTVYYNKLQDAIDSATSGQTIVVMRDVTETSKITVNKDITLELGTNKITNNNSIVINSGNKLTIHGGTNGTNTGTIENTAGTAIENHGTLILGNNTGANVEDKPIIKGKETAITSDGTFNYESGTLIGSKSPAYTGNPIIPVYYYIYTEKQGDLYHTYLKKDTTPPVVKALNLTDTVVGAGEEFNLVISISEPESGINPDDFTVSDLVFKMDGGIITPEIVELTFVGAINGDYRYNLTIKGIEKDGRLYITVKKDAVINNAKLGNEQTEITLGRIYIDFTSPNLEDSILKLVRPESGLTTDGEYEVSISNVEDEYGIAEYRWEIKKAEDLKWQVIKTINSTSNSSFITGVVEEEGTYQVRVRVSDTHGNNAYSGFVEFIYKKDLSYNAKPTISFKKEVVSISQVKIHAIIKSTSEITAVEVNGSLLPEEKIKENVIEEGQYQIRTELTYDAFVNTVYKFIVTDSRGNISEAVFNVTDISREAAKISYKIIDSTVLDNAKIVFRSSDDVVLNSVPTGFEAENANISTTYRRELTVKVTGNLQEINQEFEFSNNIGNITKVQVTGMIDTPYRNIRTVANAVKTLQDVYSGAITIERAEKLVNRMKMARLSERGESYYGIDANQINIRVSSTDELSIVKTLGGATTIQAYDVNGMITTLTKGNVEIITSADGDVSTNSNKTGVYIRESSLATREQERGTGLGGNSFHITIINR